MGERNFSELLVARQAEGKHLCVGLDPNQAEFFPPYLRQVKDVSGAFSNFLLPIIESVGDLVCAFKPNLAFYLRHGGQGLGVLIWLIDKIRRQFPGVPVILDGKFGDIGNSSEDYAEFAYDVVGADAVTVNPYMGQGALAPFLKRPDKGVFVLCRTSNPGASELQNLPVLTSTSLVTGASRSNPLYEMVALAVREKWNERDNCGLVVGATALELAQVKATVPHMPLLIPGVGAQGGKLEDVVPLWHPENGRGMIINLSRSVLKAENPRQEVEKTNGEIATLLKGAV